MKGTNLKHFALGALIATIGLWATAVNIPNTFSGGTTVSASAMNANFAALKQAVDALEAKVSALGNNLALASKEGKMGYAWIDNATADSSVPSASYAFNSSGGAVTVVRSGSGIYKVSFAGLGAGGSTSGGTVQVSAYIAPGKGIFIAPIPRSCNVVDWGSSAANIDINVRCYDLAGTLVDSRFTVLFVW